MFPEPVTYLPLAALLLVMTAPPAFGAEVKLRPSLSLKEEYNDNIVLGPVSSNSDFITTLTPQVDFSSAVERGRTSLSGGINQLVYARQNSLDATDYFGRGGFDWRWSPRLALSGAASFVRDSRPDRIDQESGLAQAAGSKRRDYQLSLMYAVNEKSNLSLSYTYDREDFNNSGFLDTRLHSVNLSQDYDLERYFRQTRVVGMFGYMRSTTDISRVDYYTLTVGLNRKIHEVWSLSMNAGYNITHSSVDTYGIQFDDYGFGYLVPMTVTSDDQGWVGNLSLNYSGERTTGSLTVSHDITSSSGRSGASRRSSASLALQRRFTPEFSGNFDLGYYLNKRDAGQAANQATDEGSLRLNCALRYEFNKNMSLEGNYRFTNVDYHNGRNPTQNAFMLRLVMGLDLLDK